jgi:hypothetical protein
LHGREDHNLEPQGILVGHPNEDGPIIAGRFQAGYTGRKDMEEPGLHRGLELRLKALAARIRTLKEKMERAEALQRIEDLGEIDQLERRYKLLQGRLDELNREGKGFRHGVKNELEKLSYDLSGAVEDFIIRIDSGYGSERRRK